jgi:hypothetical protein
MGTNIHCELASFTLLSSLHFAASIAASIAVSIAASGCRFADQNHCVVYYCWIETNWQPAPSALMISHCICPVFTGNKF